MPSDTGGIKEAEELCNNFFNTIEKKIPVCLRGIQIVSDLQCRANGMVPSAFGEKLILESGKMKSVMVIAAIAALLSPVALGAVIVDDHFDDGNVGTNTGGIGTGFKGEGIWGGQLTEADSKVKLATPDAGWQQSVIASKEGAAIGSVARFEFSGVGFAKNPTNWGSGTDRLILGVSASNDARDGGLVDARDVPGVGADTGFWVGFETDCYVKNDNQSWSGTSCLFYESSTNVRTLLASWTFDTLNWDDNDPLTMNFTPVLDITLDLSPNAYALTISGDTISNLTGSLSGSFSNELTIGHAAAYEQCEAPGVDLTIDRIIITESVPEPATLALLGLGALATLRKRK